MNQLLLEKKLKQSEKKMLELLIDVGDKPYETRNNNIKNV